MTTVDSSAPQLSKQFIGARYSLKTLADDAPFYLGAGLIGYGAWLWWPPAGFISAGMLVLAGALLLDFAKGVL